MEKYNSLSHEHLRRYSKLNKFSFKSTDELPQLKNILGQKSGEEAMQFGLKIDHSSYNIYLSGEKGTGKTNYTKQIIKEISKEKAVPDDWCYVYCFDTPRNAIALNLPAGKGRILQKDMDKLLEDLVVNVPEAFNSDDYERQKNEVVKQYQEQKNTLLQYLTEFSKERRYSLKSTSSGFVFTPIKEKEEEDYTQEDLEQDLEEIHEEALNVMLKIKNLEIQAKNQLLKQENDCALFVVKPLIDELILKHKEHKRVIEYLKNVEKDMVENIYYFIPEEGEEGDTDSKKLLSDPFLKRYRVNLFIDNSKTNGAPVVFEYNPSLIRLTGAMEYENVNGVTKTDFLMVKPGSIQLANGGYLILEAKQLLTNPYAWESLKRILQTKEIAVESLGSQLGISEAAALKLEAIPIKLKIIMIGSEMIYHLLYNYDEDFQKYFKILVSFDYEMDRDDESELKIAQFIKSYTNEEKMLPFDAPAVGRIVEHSSRLTGNQNKLSLKFNKIIEVIIESNEWAKIHNRSIVTAIDVDKAIAKKLDRVNKYKNKVQEMFDNEKVLIDVKGNKIGVVNGLSVLSIGEFSFGKPSVITVTTSMGKEGIINIEREVNLSGDIYDKGVMILSGFIQEKFAQRKNISFTASICFEQSYGGVDGDSASSAELYALLSSLGKVPLKQYIAVTGSVNQKGYIQPVGGITEKVEGFYDLCKKRGFTGKQGVIIPYQNIDNLMLKDEVVEAVKEGQFHVYTVKHVNEGIELMTGLDHKKVYELVENNLNLYLNK